MAWHEIRHLIERVLSMCPTSHILLNTYAPSDKGRDKGTRNGSFKNQRRASAWKGIGESLGRTSQGTVAPGRNLYFASLRARTGRKEERPNEQWPWPSPEPRAACGAVARPASPPT